MNEKNIKEIDLAQILCTKLCHDLAGPITGIYNGTELLEESDAEMKEQALDLISFSAKQAANRLKIVRQAYGSMRESSMSVEDLKELFTVYFDKTKTTVEWSQGIVSQGSIDGSAAKLLMNLIICINSCIPFGGKIAIDFKDRRLVLNAAGDKIKIDDWFEKILINKQKPDVIESKNVHYLFTSILAQGMNLETTNNGNSVSISFQVSNN